MNRYLPGSVVVITARCTVEGVLTDPTTIQVLLQDPTQDSPISSTPIRVSTGVFTKTVPVNFLTGIWLYAFVAAGTGEATSEGEFTVVTSRLLTGV